MKPFLYRCRRTLHLHFIIKREFNLRVSFSTYGIVMGTSLGLCSHNSVPRSDISSVRSGRHGVPTADADASFAAWVTTRD